MSVRQDAFTAVVIVGAPFATRVALKAVWLTISVFGSDRGDMFFEPTWETGLARVNALKQASKAA